MRRLLRGTAGSVAVETTLLIGTLLLLFMTIMEGGHLIYSWAILHNVTREAARYGAVADESAVNYQNFAKIRSDVQSYAGSQFAQYSGLPSPTISVSVGADPSTGWPSTVSVTSSFTVPMITPLVHAIKPSVSLTATSVMRAEG